MQTFSQRRLVSNWGLKKEASDSPNGSLHLEFIQDQALLAGDEGADAVEAYHRSVFLYHHAAPLERWDQQGRIHEDRLRTLEGRLAEVQGQLSGAPRSLRSAISEGAEPRAATAWNGWDLAMFVVSGLGAVALLVFGILNISFNLLESGLVTFQENPLRAYFWAALLPVGALAVKVGWDFTGSGRPGKTYLWACFIIGLSGVLGWVAAYSTIYPSLSKNTAERIQSLTVFDSGPAGGGLLLGTNAAGTRWIDVILVGSQALAEIFLSAVLGIYMTQLFHRHHAPRTAGDPRYSELERERRELERTIAGERAGLAECRGERQRIEHQLAALIAYARSVFHREQRLHRDQSHQQRLLLDRLTEQLREQLGALTTVNGAVRPPREEPRNVSALERR